MLKNFVKGKTAVFIDSANIYFSQKSLGWKIDFKKLLTYLNKETDLFRAGFYGAINPDNAKEKKFHDFLEIIGYVVKHKEIKFVKDEKDGERGGHHKGNVDVDITIDVVHLRDSYDTCVLMSGDGDFESLFKYLKSFGKRCVVISASGHISFELIRQAKFIDFKKLRSEIEMK